jgi:hypothetical protein
MSCNNNHRCDSCENKCKVESQNVELDKWYCSLNMKNKELVVGVKYPESTEVWLSFSREEKVDAIKESGLYRIKVSSDCVLGHDF